MELFFPLPHSCSNPTNCMYSTHLNILLLSIQEVHQWPQDIICILCNCVSGISSRICCPFHLTENIRHLLDALINPSLKAAQIGEKQKQYQWQKYKVQNFKFTQFHTFLSWHLLLFSLLYCYQRVYSPVPYAHHPHTADHLWTQDMSMFQRTLFIHLAARNNPFLTSRNAAILSSKHPAVAFAFSTTETGISHGAMTQCTPHSEHPGVHQQKSSYDPSELKSLK